MRIPKLLPSFALLFIAEDELLTYTTAIDTHEFDQPVVPGWARGSFGVSFGGPETQWEPVLGEMDLLIVQWVERGLEFVILNNGIPQ